MTFGIKCPVNKGQLSLIGPIYSRGVGGGKPGSALPKGGTLGPLCSSLASLWSDLGQERLPEKKGAPGGGHSPADGNCFLPGQRGVTKFWHGAGCVL